MFCTSSRLTPRPAFTLSEVLITLGVIGLIAALTGAAVKINDRFKEEQSAKQVEGSIMEITAALAKYQAMGGTYPLSTDLTKKNDLAVLLQHLEGVPYTGYFKNIWNTTNHATVCQSMKCIRLKNGSVLMINPNTETNFYQIASVFNTSRFGFVAAQSILLDPNPLGNTPFDQTVALYITNNGNVDCNSTINPTWFKRSNRCSNSLDPHVREGSTPAQIQADFASKGW